jgi:hypothetical protein
VRFQVPSKNVKLVEKFSISFSSTKNHKIITLQKKRGGGRFICSFFDWEGQKKIQKNWLLLMQKNTTNKEMEEMEW